MRQVARFEGRRCGGHESVVRTFSQFVASERQCCFQWRSRRRGRGPSFSAMQAVRQLARIVEPRQFTSTVHLRTSRDTADILHPTDMNIFRLTGDLSHLVAIIVLLLKIWKTRSCSGECALPIVYVPTNRPLCRQAFRASRKFCSPLSTRRGIWIFFPTSFRSTTLQ